MITFSRLSPTTPAGYSIRTTRRWSDPLMQSYSYDAVLRDNIGQFSLIEFYINGRLPGETSDRWLGNWGAITNFNKLTHADMMHVARAQVAQFGLNWTDAQLIDQRKTPLPDGWTLQSKMGWLYQNMTGATIPPGLVMWGQGEWWEAQEVRYGTMVHAGQSIAVSDTVYSFRVQMPKRTTWENVTMRRLLAFRRGDLTRYSVPYLWQRATTAIPPDNRYGEAPKGVILCPVALDARDFDFAGQFMPEGYYIPEIWLQPT